jgi:hypothetical protein
LGFVAQDQTNMKADSLGVAIDKPFREVLGPAARYICVLDGVHSEFLFGRLCRRSRACLTVRQQRFFLAPN